MIFGLIYKATNLINNKVYIGQTTKTIKRRREQHLLSRKQRKYFFHNALEKHGIDNFLWEEIDSAENREELDNKEIYWIEFYKSTDRNFGYNCKSGGSVPEFNQATRDKISKATKGRKSSEETKNKLKEIHKGKGIRPKDYVYTDEHKEKISKANKGKIQPIKSEETRRKQSEKMKGRAPYVITEEIRKKISESGKGRVPWNKGIACTEDVKKKISIGNKGKIRSAEFKKNVSEFMKQRPPTCLGKPMHKNTKNALLLANVGRVCSEETKRKIAESQKGEKSKNYGKKNSEESNIKKSIAVRKMVELKKELGIPWKQKIPDDIKMLYGL